MDIEPTKFSHSDIDFSGKVRGEVVLQLALPPGRYRAIPYILIEPEDVPYALLSAIGLQVNSLGAGYLQKPMRWEGGWFEIF